MDLFRKFTEALKQSVAAIRGPGDPAGELLEAIDKADNWQSLERKLAEQRCISRRRQQEVLESLDPLATKVEALLAQAKTARIKVVRENLLRQAEGYMHQLEAEDYPAEIHSANCRMLTQLIKQVQRAAAMQAAGVTADAVEGVAVQLEDIVENYESAAGAVSELEPATAAQRVAPPEAAAIASRLGAIHAAAEGARAPDPDRSTALRRLEARLYEA